VAWAQSATKRIAPGGPARNPPTSARGPRPTTGASLFSGTSAVPAPYHRAMSEPRNPVRPMLVEVSGQAVTRVVIRFGATTFVGEADVAEHAGPGPAAAAAAAQALEAATPDTVTMSVPWSTVVETPADSPDLYVALVDVHVAGVRMQHAGAVPIKQHEAVAAARAVLDAVNRRLEIMQP
jgi:hypothetical protein